MTERKAYRSNLPNRILDSRAMAQLMDWVTLAFFAFGLSIVLALLCVPLVIFAKAVLG
jgi:hypothetical protein